MCYQTLQSPLPTATPGILVSDFPPWGLCPSRSRWWRSPLYSSRAEPRCESVHAFICLWQRQKTLSFVSPHTVTVSREPACRHMHTFSTPCSEDWMTGGDSFPYGKRRGQAISMAHCTCLTERGKKEWEGKIRGDAKSLPQIWTCFIFVNGRLEL